MKHCAILSKYCWNKKRSWSSRSQAVPNLVCMSLRVFRPLWNYGNTTKKMKVNENPSWSGSRRFKCEWTLMDPCGGSRSTAVGKRTVYVWLIRVKTTAGSSVRSTPCKTGSDRNQNPEKNKKSIIQKPEEPLWGSHGESGKIQIWGIGVLGYIYILTIFLW